MIFIGIDPGLSGAIASVDERGELQAVEDMPVMANGKGASKVKNQVNAAALRDILMGLKAKTTQCVVGLERISSMPGQGVASMFSMGDSFGSIRAVVACCDIRLEVLSSRTWKNHFKLTADKEQSRAKAIQLFPAAAASLSRIKDHNRAESILLASYLRDIS